MTSAPSGAASQPASTSSLHNKQVFRTILVTLIQSKAKGSAGATQVDGFEVGLNGARLITANNVRLVARLFGSAFDHLTYRDLTVKDEGAIPEYDVSAKTTSQKEKDAAFVLEYNKIISTVSEKYGKNSRKSSDTQKYRVDPTKFGRAKQSYVPPKPTGTHEIGSLLDDDFLGVLQPKRLVKPGPNTVKAHGAIEWTRLFSRLAEKVIKAGGRDISGPESGTDEEYDGFEATPDETPTSASGQQSLDKLSTSISIYPASATLEFPDQTLPAPVEGSLLARCKINRRIQVTDSRLKGDLDLGKQKDLQAGEAAAKSIMSRADEAVQKEHHAVAVLELQSRVEDWKGHRINHFGDLLHFGNYSCYYSLFQCTRSLER
ncbi:MAG: hypothetical protein Q9161_000982 [Pseudevernia consocians]